MLWNLFLAIVPVGLGWLLASMLREERSRRQGWLCALVAAAWLAFLPNTSYLFTGWRHFFNYIDGRDLFLMARESHGTLLYFLAVAGVYLVYTSMGAVTFTLAVRPLERLAREWRLPVNLLAIPFFFLMAHGVYLGLVLRFNSWDLVTRPGVIFQASLEAMTRPALLAVTVGFAVVLWLTYLLVDVWLDGAFLRWTQWTYRSRQAAQG